MRPQQQSSHLFTAPTAAFRTLPKLATRLISLPASASSCCVIGTSTPSPPRIAYPPSRSSYFSTLPLKTNVPRQLKCEHSTYHPVSKLPFETKPYSTMSAKLIPQHPSDVMVIRDLSPSIATFSVPFSRFGTIKIGGRGTLVKLSSGSLAVFSPVALTDATKTKVDQMGGKVGYIVALDIEHHIFISEWAKAYPDAKVVGPAGLPEKRAKMLSDPKIEDNKFDVVFNKDTKRDTHISEEFDADFDYEYVDGHANLELVFFYKPEKMLIQADLMFNLPATEQYSRLPPSERQEKGLIAQIFAGVQSTEGDAKWMKRFNWYLAGKDRDSYNDSLKKVEEWDFVSIIPCHGDFIEGNGKEVFHKVFEWHLHGKK